ncbi:SDR family oxidoreductase [Sorangium sp. So ce315]|uniref:SDR family NAD(P)-dependent oxidoreductase n=1 Tax=Sorangium sp. So ce315 TaxID=3133299 RepID=UPI003F62AFD9
MSSTSKRNPVALITGGSRGLGKSMALHLADHGAGVVITYRGAAAEAADVVKQIEEKGGKAAALALDVGDIRSLDAFAGAVKAELAGRFGRDQLDCLVNNAGIGVHKSFAETTEEQFDALMNVHLKGTFFLTQKLLPLIADGGRILNISSGLTRFTFAGYAAYATMKGGVEVLTRYLAKELGPRKITVNVLAPGAIETDFGGGAVRDNAELNRMLAGQTALGRVGLPDDIGGVVALLLAPESGWINGHRIEASGGMFL